MLKISPKLINYCVPFILFFFISIAYFSPEIFESKKLNQHDVMQFKGMSKEISDHREKYGEEPLWTNSMYGGMPAYLVSTRYSGNILKKVHYVFTLMDFRPVCFIFLYLTGAYIALLLFGVNPWLSFAGAIAYAFSTYFLIIIEAGHISKVLALGYMPPVIAGTYVAFKGKALAGSVVAGLFLGLQILVNHLQITYYTFLCILILLAFIFVEAIINRKLNSLVKPIMFLALFVTLAIGSNFSNLITTYEYGKYSIRGRSELTSNKENQTSGLDKDYATQWSYGIGETFTLLIPDFKGGSSTGSLSQNSHTYKYMKSTYGASEARRFIAQVPLYFGEQPGTSGPVYVGAVIVFLFVLGLFIVKGPIKWWLLAVTCVSIILAWGHNFAFVTNIMLDYFPGYNKFRTVSMTLVMAEFAMPVLAIYTVMEIMNGKVSKALFMQGFKYTLFGLGGLMLLILLVSGSISSVAPVDEQYRSQGLDGIVDAIQLDRLSMVRMDILRSLVFVGLTAGLIYALSLNKIRFKAFIILFSVLLLADLWPVNKRYLNGKDFVTHRQEQNSFVAATADQLILNDKEPDYRVLNLTVSPLQDATTSYFHKSIGGYHGAKMRRFQELFQYHIQPEIERLYDIMKTRPVLEAIDSTMAGLNALNMLNTRYFIYNPDAPPLVNKFELGNAWFVQNVIKVGNADAELAAIGKINPAKEAIVDKRYQSYLEGFQFAPDSAASIKLTDYKANELTYKSSCSTEQLTVFSEVYYDKGWQAYIDDKPVPHFRVNYLLRAMRLPAGEHTIVFKFHPDSYFIGEKIALASSLILILLVIGTVFLEFKKSGSVSEESDKA